MKQIILSLLASGLFLANGYAEDGTSMLSQADALAQESKTSLLQVNDKTKAAAEKVADVTQQATAAISTAEDLMGNLNLSMDDLKAKVASLDKAQLLAFAEKYKTMFAENEALIASATSKLEELSWFKRLGTDGRALKKQITGYTAQLGTLKEQYSVYTDQLKVLGVDLSAYGL